jgi:hypothetical protein
MLFVVVYLYASSLTLWALNITWWFKKTHILLMDYPDMSLPDRRIQANENVVGLKMGIAMEALFMFNVRARLRCFVSVADAMRITKMIVGDSVVIWRAWVLYPNHIWAVCIPCLMLTMSFGKFASSHIQHNLPTLSFCSVFSVIDITCLTGAGWSSLTAIADGGPVCKRAELIAWAFSFVTNASCTILIGLRAW